MYLKILISSIYTAQNNGPMSDIWKFTSNLYFAFATSIYLVLFYLIINNHLLPEKLNFLKLKLTNHPGYNLVINVAIYFMLPLMFYNYYIAYQNDKYKSLIKQHETFYNKKAFALYFLSAFLTMFLILIFKI